MASTSDAADVVSVQTEAVGSSEVSLQSASKAADGQGVCDFSPALAAGSVADDGEPQEQPGQRLLENLEKEVGMGDVSKWTEIINAGVPQYMQAHPDRFQRRVRRGIPLRLRWEIWKSRLGLVGTELAEEYDKLCEPRNEWSERIEVDVGRTFADLKTFDEQPQRLLFKVLNAYAAHNPELGYCQGMNFVAGLLLIVSRMNPQESFTVLNHLMKEPRFNLAGFYGGKLPLLRRYLQCCDKFVAQTVPDLRDHFIKEQVQPAVYLHQWFLTMFINCFPLSMVLIMWDVIIVEGLPVILRIAVSILQVLKDSLLSMPFEEIIRFFKMMKSYDDEEGDLNAYRIGQLLMKHTEHVQLPKRVLDSLTQEYTEDEVNGDSEEAWEARPSTSEGTWFQSLSRMFSFSGGGGGIVGGGAPAHTTSRWNTLSSGGAVGHHMEAYVAGADAVASAVGINWTAPTYGDDTWYAHPA